MTSNRQLASLGRALLWAAPVGVLALVLTWLSTSVPNLFFEDDAYFYLQIAWNLAAGRGPTFDGLHPTSGFHLLWMGLLTPLAWCVQAIGLGKLAFVFVATLAALALAVATARTLCRSLAERAFIVALALFCGVTMEGTLLGALLALMVTAWAGERRLGPLMLGGIAALVPLARVDYAWFAPALVTATWLLERGRRAATTDASSPDAAGASPGGTGWFPIVLGTVVGVALHAGIELAVFGHPVTVSSVYKADLLARRGVAFLVADNVSRTANQIRFVFLAGLTLLALGPRRPLARPHVVLAAAWLPVLVYLGINYLRDWYWYPPLVLATWSSTRLAHGHGRLRQRIATGYVVTIVAASAAYLALNAGDWRRTRLIVGEINRALPQGSIVYQIDGSGFSGWSLRVPVVNGDGLVNSWTYRERWQRDALGTYPAEEGITHILTYGLAWRPYHGLDVDLSQLPLLADTGPMRNERSRVRLFRLR